MSTQPTPDAFLAALWDTEFDLPQAAATLRIPLARFVLLLQQPPYAEPLDAMHQAARKCLDLKAAKSVGVIIDALRADLEACPDQPESRRIATALTKAVNAATRLTKGASTRAARATDCRSGLSVLPPTAAPAATPPSPKPQSTIPDPQCPSPSHRITVSSSHPLVAAAGRATAA
jgi:hypothetical protein